MVALYHPLLPFLNIIFGFVLRPGGGGGGGSVLLCKTEHLTTLFCFAALINLDFLVHTN